MNKEKRQWPEGGSEPPTESEGGWGPASGEEGAIGYILLWVMGVPASILFVIFLLRGCN
jgi:hypothetical protein